ncbi:MAG: hypothetical protein DRI74_02545 [Bacteroidetes bacterium]|nr:MAG: hypothetical protein DRI74_02545 [Bacteroidota bacterium]
MHWIEEAEQNKNKRESKRKNIHTKIDQKKDDVQKNWEKNNQRYTKLIKSISEYTDRINNLPRESRLEFGRIETKHKDSSLHNHLVKYSSSRRRIVRKFNGIFSPFKAKHYKNTRNIFISLSRKIDYIYIETKEIYAPRIRLNEEEESGIFTFLHKLKAKERSIVKRSKSHMKISDINNDFILYFIDFLSFKNNGKKYFITDDTSEISEEF